MEEWEGGRGRFGFLLTFLVLMGIRIIIKH